MFFRSSFDSVLGDAAWRERERFRRRRELALQAVIAFVIVVTVVALAVNVRANLDARHIQSGFGFLFQRAGFEVSDKLIAFTSASAVWKGFLVGLLNTLRVAALTIVTATMLGVVVGLMRLSRNALLRFLGAAHVEVYRNIPLLVLLLAIYLTVSELLPGVREAVGISGWIYLSKSGLVFAVPQWGEMAVVGSLAVGALLGAWVSHAAQRRTTRQLAAFYGLAACLGSATVLWFVFGMLGGWNQPQPTRFSISGGVQLTPEFVTLWLGLTLFTSASIAEIVRAGVLSVRTDQWLAGMALGLTYGETTSYVVFPQALKLIMPPLSSQYMSLTKNSSLAVLVGYPDLVNIGTTVMNVTGQAIEVIFIIMSVYLVINLLISLAMNGLNQRIMQGQ